MIVDPSDICLSIGASSATTYTRFSGSRSSLRNRLSYMENFEKSRSDNHLSLSGSRKLRRSITWLANVSRVKSVYQKDLKRHVKFRLSFVTLTLPASQIHSDKEIKRECLAVFLQWLRDSYNVKKYVWRAELQTNQNIHFHITMDKYIHYATIQKAWNRCVGKLGYIDRFENLHGHRDPHSTEIKSVKHVKNLGGYLAGYLVGKGSNGSKKDNEIYHKRVIDGRLFGVSSYLSQIKNIGITAEELDFGEVISKLKQVADKVIYSDYSSTYIYSREVCQSFIYWLHHRGYKNIFESSGLTSDDLRSWLVVESSPA